MVLFTQLFTELINLVNEELCPHLIPSGSLYTQAFNDECCKIWEQKWDEVVSRVFSSGLMP